MPRRLTLDEVLVRFKEVHNERYDYSLIKEYKNNSTKLPIVCNEHGLFYQSTDKHLSKQGCRQCGFISTHNKQRLGIDKFINRAIEKHDNLFDYSEIKQYINDSTKVPIKCKNHGIFYQTPNAHLQGRGCNLCGIEITNKKSNFLSIEALKNNPDNFKVNAKLYFLELRGNGEHFYKIGYTVNSINTRYAEKIFYNISTVSILETNIIDAREKEQKFLVDFSRYKYEPEIRFPGHTECFNNNIYNKMFKEI
jgi:hypothetical protein